MSVKRNRRLVPCVGWVTPKAGYCWVNSGANRIRLIGIMSVGVWGSRKWPDGESIGEQWSDR